MRRRDFATGLLLGAAARMVRAQTSAKQHRIAIVRPAGSVAQISDTGTRFYRAFFEELRRMGDIEGKNLTVERYSGEGRPEGFADLAREVVSRNPDVIVAINDAIAQAAHAASGTIPIVWVTGRDPTRTGLITSLAHPGGNVTGVTVQEGGEIWGKRLQILKEAVPSASRVAFLGLRSDWEETTAPRELSRQLQISLIPMLLEESTPSEYRRVFGEIAKERPDAIMPDGRAELIAYDQLIVELANRSRLPAMCPWRDYAEAGGLIAYGADLGEAARRAADNVHEILNGGKPGDIPMYRPTIYELVVNLKTAKALGLTIPPSLLADADEVIE